MYLYVYAYNIYIYICTCLYMYMYVCNNLIQHWMESASELMHTFTYTYAHTYMLTLQSLPLNALLLGVSRCQI